MNNTKPDINRQAKPWRLLKGLRPRKIDLRRINLIRQLESGFLADAENLMRLLPLLGLNDEGLEEFPQGLHARCGQGLLIWQYPLQFGPYLATLSRLGVRSYLELGVRHGGSYVATVEILNRFRELDFAVAVDIIPCPGLVDYQVSNSRSRFVCMNSQSDDFIRFVADLPTIDLVFIDSHHEENQCRREFAALSPYANMIAFHDVCSAHVLALVPCGRKSARCPTGPASVSRTSTRGSVPAWASGWRSRRTV